MAQKIRLNFSLNCAVFIKKTTSFTIFSKKIAAPRYFTVKILKALTLTLNDYIYLCNNKKIFIKLKMSPALYQTHFQIIQSDFCPDFCINVNTGKLLYFVFALFIENRIVYYARKHVVAVVVEMYAVVSVQFFFRLAVFG